MATTQPTAQPPAAQLNLWRNLWLDMWRNIWRNQRRGVTYGRNGPAYVRKQRRKLAQHGRGGTDMQP